MIACFCTFNWKLGQNESNLAHLHGFHEIKVLDHMIIPLIWLFYFQKCIDLLHYDLIGHIEILVGSHA